MFLVIVGPIFGFGTGGHYNISSCLETSDFRLSSPRNKAVMEKKRLIKFGNPKVLLYPNTKIVS